MSLVIDAQAEPIPGYRLIDRLGSGGFGDVWKAEAPGGLLKAIKVIHGDLRSADEEGSRHAEQELHHLKRLQSIRHPYLLSIERYDVIEGRLLIVTELADCNLWDRFRECRAQNLPGIPRLELLRYMEEAAEVLDVMNSQYQLQHLDIKPQNLFLVFNHVKVADFGLVKDLEGMRGTITGGVTPVYAAPETFENIVTRYCDQYSLAIVYQELLVGARPFNGTSGQQLLMQHLREAPNVSPLPSGDRAAVARALSKKPEDRFPSCLHFVRALQQAGEAAAGNMMESQSARTDTPLGNWKSIAPMAPSTLTGTGPKTVLNPASQPPETPRTELRYRREETSVSSADFSIPARVAPPEMTGEGCLLPAIIIGIGGMGLEVAREMRRMVQERYGSFERVANLRLIYLDTDSETLHQATATGPGCLAPTEVVPARLNRAAHYLKPRRNGRSLIEGWFDPQMLYRIPRSPATVGIRALGRLAFLDHYRSFSEKLRESIEAVTHPDTLGQADRATRLGLRSNRPRVYIVTGLGGGTGGGMFLDAAYVARHKLRSLGYEPDVTGLFLLPAADRNNAKGPLLSNTYTALRELYHYSMPETVFSASYEERDAQIHDGGAPFNRFFALPLNPMVKGNLPPGMVDEVPRRAATFLRQELLSPMGRSADEVRPAQDKTRVVVSTFGQAAFTWPKEMILSQTARWFAGSVLSRWTTRDPEILRGYVQTWLKARWDMEQIGPEPLMEKLYQACEKAFGQPPENFFQNEAQPLVPKGWFAREPEAAKIWLSLTRLQQCVGMPDERAMQRQVGKLEQQLDQATDELTREVSAKVARLATLLLEHPDYRLVGAEEAVRQTQFHLDQALSYYEIQAVELSANAIDAYYLVQNYLNADRNQKRPSVAEMAEAMKNWPKWRYQSLVMRQLSRLYLTVKTQLADQLRELQFCRQRLVEMTEHLHQPRAEYMPNRDSILLPPNVTSIEQAIDSLQKSITPEDYRAFDKQLQIHIEQEFNALFNVCLSSVNMLGRLQQTIEEQARGYLSKRLGDSNIAQMFFARYPDMNSAAKAMKWVYDQATPPIRPMGAGCVQSCVLALPPREQGEPFKQIALRALNVPDAALAETTDEVLIYREYAELPMTALAQLGPLAEDAYNNALGSSQGSPHSRADVPSWFDVEE